MFHPYLCLFHSTWPGLVPSWTHLLPAQNPTLRRKSSSTLAPPPLYTGQRLSVLCHPHPASHSAFELVFPLLEGYFPRSSHGYGHSGLRLNGTFSNRTSQLRMPLSRIVPLLSSKSLPLRELHIDSFTIFTTKM